MRLVLALVLVLGGCASMTEVDCRSTDWYALGERDGLYGLQARIDTYAYQCERQNVAVASNLYMDGWWMGNATYRDRMAHDGGM
jgi:hypothetical protein